MHIKIFVNFKDKKVIHTEAMMTSDEVRDLQSKGYEKVGTVKDGNVKIFWETKFFNPKDKYQRHIKDKK